MLIRLGLGVLCTYHACNHTITERIDLVSHDWGTEEWIWNGGEVCHPDTEVEPYPAAWNIYLN